MKKFSLDELYLLINSIENTFERFNYDSKEDLVPSYSSQSIKSILSSKKTYSCFERCLITAYFMTKNNIHVKLVTIFVKRPLQEGKVACALEFSINGKTYSFVSGDKHNVIINKIYPHRSSHKSVKKVNFFPNTKLSWSQHFGIPRFSEFKELFSSYNFEKSIKQIIQKREQNQIPEEIPLELKI